MLAVRSDRTLCDANIWRVTSMTRVFVVVVTLVFSAATSAYAGAMTEEQVESVEAAIKAVGCTIEETNISTRGTDITAKGERYMAEHVECKDGNYNMTLDNDFKIVNKKKEVGAANVGF
jgi:hypothetical protein